VGVVNRPIIFVLLGLLSLATIAAGTLNARTGAPQDQQAVTPSRSSDSKTLIYADFERIESGRPVSARGGLIQLYGYEESRVHKSTFKGLEGATPAAPELVRIKKDDPNRAMKFDYSLLAPNQWAGVAVEIHGLPDANGAAVPEDVSGFKTLSLEVFATGVPILRLEAISGERGRDMSMTYPQMTFKVRQGLNTYKVPLTGFAQPAWVTDRRVDPKDIFKKLTSINLTAFCDQCEQSKQGMVIVDNVIFEK
jgi:hypothetical protein